LNLQLALLKTNPPTTSFIDVTVSIHENPSQSYGASPAIWDHWPTNTDECAPP